MSQEAIEDGGRGLVIFLGGIPSSGKSATARNIRAMSSAFRVLAGDDLVRAVPFSQRVARGQEIFANLLDRAEEWSAASHVVVDSALTAAQATQARRRFPSLGLFVVLRIDEAERQRREKSRSDRKLVYWDPSWHATPGLDDLYDLVIDTKARSAEQAASEILAAASEQWPDLVDLNPELGD